MERNNNSSYTQKGDRNKCEIYRRTALGNAACKILANIILARMKPYIEKIKEDYQNGFRDGSKI